MPERAVRVAVLVSGSGSNLEAILKAQKEGRLGRAEVALVLSNKPGVLALERAKRYGISAAVVDHTAFSGDDEFQRKVCQTLVSARIDVVCLAGYLRKLGACILERYRDRIINIHPALLPKFGGPGMYGHHVHEAVLAAQEKESGCTAHMVDEEYDHGKIVAQARVPVLPGDTPERLAERVLEQEHKLYPKVLREFCDRLIK